MKKMKRNIPYLLCVSVLLCLSISSFAQTTNPTGCAVTGTVIFKEDFGGNSPSDPFERSTGIPQVVGYTYSCPGLGNSNYCICKQSTDNGGLWYAVDDHTYPNDLTRGYLFSVDADIAAGQFYISQIDNLCTGTRLYFSLWAVCLDVATYMHAANLKIRIETVNGDSLKEIATGDLPFGNPNWQHFGTDFIIPSGQSSVVYKITNNTAGGWGNDLAIDDIEIRLCAPPVTLTQTPIDTMLCTGMSYSLEAGYTDDGTFQNSLVYRWEKNTTGDINNPSAWTPVAGTQGTSSNGIVHSIYTISPVSMSDAGHYRLVVENTANIDNYNCRAMSDIVWVKVATDVVSGVIRPDTIICYNTAPATLTSTAATGGSVALTYQWQESTNGGNTWTNVTTGGTTPNYTPSALTQTTNYRLITVGGNAPCETDTSNVITVTVYAQLKGGTTGTSQTYCYGILPTIFLGETPASGGSGNYTYLWENSTDNGNTWINTSVTTLTYTFVSALTQTTFYRRIVTDAVCGMAYSDTVQITINPLPLISINMPELCVGVIARLIPETDGTWTSSDPLVAKISDDNRTVTALSTGPVILSYTSNTTSCTENLNFTVDAYPDVYETTGKPVVCVTQSIELTNQTLGGVWTKSNDNITFSNSTANPVTITGATEGYTYVTYTVYDGICRTTRTFRVKVISNTPPTIKIGIKG
jgi:hypothetical protein